MLYRNSKNLRVIAITPSVFERLITFQYCVPGRSLERNAMKKIMITGALGQIGSELTGKSKKYIWNESCYCNRYKESGS